MTRGTYITIQDWMLALGIGGNDLLAYALVYGFCQDGKSCFKGSYEYIAAWLGCNRSTVIRVVARLVEQGLLRKEDRYVNGVKFCDLYALVPEDVQNATGGGNLRPTQWQNATGGGGNLQHHKNREHNAIAYRDNNTPLPPFNFRQALLDAGVSAETADAWLTVRKAKRSVNSELAFRETMKEVRKSGRSAEECIRFSAARSWAGFMAQWLEREENGMGTARARKVDPVTYMVRQMQREQEMRNYNPQDDLPNIDEQ